LAAVLFEVSPLTIDHALQFLYDIRKLKQYIDSNQGRRLSAQTIEFVDLYLVIGWAPARAHSDYANTFRHSICVRAGCAFIGSSRARGHDPIRPI
jgi:hypothetical protein